MNSPSRSVLLRLMALVALALFPLRAEAQTAYRVKDIVPGPEGSNPMKVTESGGRVFFVVTSGPELGLWVTDGTEMGTRPVAPLNIAGKIFDIQGVALMAVNDGVGVRQLWRSDGTVAGTYALTSVSPSPIESGGGATLLISHGPVAYFFVSIREPGCSLWKTDGSAAGTVLVKEFPHEGSNVPCPDSPTILDGVVLFWIDDLVHGRELWRTDGTGPGTWLVKDISPGLPRTSGSFRPQMDVILDVVTPPEAGSGMFVVNQATGAPTGLWRTDGTAAGTVFVHPGPTWRVDLLEEIDGTAFFATAQPFSSQSLWASGGTADTTRLLLEVPPGHVLLGGQVNGAMTLRTGPQDPQVIGELWRSDGTAEGTWRLDAGGGFNVPRAHTVTANGWQYFAAADTQHGDELWRTDGTTAGTTHVADIVPGPIGSDLRVMTSTGTHLFLAATGDGGRELWAYALPPAPLGRRDVAWRHTGSRQVAGWLGSDAGRQIYLNGTSVPDHHWKVAATPDFDGDLDLDLLWRHDETGALTAWLLQGTSLVAARDLEPAALADSRWQVAATGDFNGDGKDDLVWRQSFSGEVAVWYMNGTRLEGGTFATPSAVPDTRWSIVGAGSFDGDGGTDLLWWHAWSGQLVVWHMSGSALSWGELTSPSALPDTRWRPVATGDYNADGKTDIVWHHVASGQVVVWYMDGAALTGGAFLGEGRSPADWTVVGPR